MKNFTLFFFISLAYALGNCFSWAQGIGLAKIIPPSPNASSLGKFADTPVGFYTGIPQVNNTITK